MFWAFLETARWARWSIEASKFQAAAAKQLQRTQELREMPQSPPRPKAAWKAGHHAVRLTGRWQGMTADDKSRENEFWWTCLLYHFMPCTYRFYVWAIYGMCPYYMCHVWTAKIISAQSMVNICVLCLSTWRPANLLGRILSLYPLLRNPDPMIRRGLKMARVGNMEEISQQCMPFVC